MIYLNKSTYALDVSITSEVRLHCSYDLADQRSVQFLLSSGSIKTARSPSLTCSIFRDFVPLKREKSRNNTLIVRALGPLLCFHNGNRYAYKLEESFYRREPNASTYDVVTLGLLGFNTAGGEIILALP